jgi:light-independent protochlorophyllide reductase subunit B
MGFEGANVLFDTWVHPLMMGLEEHLLSMFREDFEFGDGAAPSHLGHAPAGRAARDEVEPAPAAEAQVTSAPLASVAAAPVVAVAAAPVASATAARAEPAAGAQSGPAPWTSEAEKELKKIPFFVRGKARRNTERFAQDRGLSSITLDTLYEAKAHFKN